MKTIITLLLFAPLLLLAQKNKVPVNKFVTVKKEKPVKNVSPVQKKVYKNQAIPVKKVNRRAIRTNTEFLRVRGVASHDETQYN